MLEPLGPLPEGVYWRRRALGLGALVVGLLLGLWGLTALAGEDDPGAQQPGSPAPGVATTSPTPSAEPATSTSAPPSSAAPSSASASAAPSSSGAPPPASAAPGSSVPAPAAPGSVAPNAGRTAAPPPPPPPPPPGPCPDQAIGLIAQPSAGEYRPGQPREFRMIIKNVGPVPCFRDLNPALQEVLVLAADGTRVWSSNDCYNQGEPSVRRLAPAEQVQSNVVWAGRTSQPGCPVRRETVPAGDYQLVVRLGPLSSPPAPFRLLR